MKKIKNLILFCLFIGLISYGINIFIQYQRQEKVDYLYFINEKEKKELAVLKKQQEKEYNECISKDYSDEMLSDTANELLNTIDDYSDKYNISYKFVTLKKNYIKEENTDKEYYGASLYKLLDIIYLIEKSNNQEINLNEEVKYLAKHKISFSTGMSKVPINSMVSLKELLSYIMLYSDNTAHMILVDYIGLTNLKQLGKDLGATHFMDYLGYGNTNIDEMYLYLSKVYELMNLDNENALFVKESLNNSNENALNFDDIKFYHKFGMYKDLYHTVGIPIIENPYIILFMTELRFKDYKGIVQTISKYFYNLNEELLTGQLNYCQNLIYGGTVNGQ